MCSSDLGEMVLRYSRPAGEAPPELLTIISRLSALRERLLSLVDEDSAAYEEVRAARSERKAAKAPGPPPERWIRALERAARVPLETAEASVQASRTLAAERGRVKPALLSDLLSSLALLRAAKEGALANVEANLASMQEEGISTADLESAVQRLRAEP